VYQEAVVWINTHIKRRGTQSVEGGLTLHQGNPGLSRKEGNLKTGHSGPGPACRTSPAGQENSQEKASSDNADVAGRSKRKRSKFGGTHKKGGSVTKKPKALRESTGGPLAGTVTGQMCRRGLDGG